MLEEIQFQCQSGPEGEGNSANRLQMFPPRGIAQRAVEPALKSAD
jgi:hypothetical protein